MGPCEIIRVLLRAEVDMGIGELIEWGGEKAVTAVCRDVAMCCEVECGGVTLSVCCVGPHWI